MGRRSDTALMAATEHIAGGVPAQRFRRMGGRIRPGVAGFWAWWTRAMASWLPLRIRKLFGLANERLMLQAGEASLQLSLERDGDARELGLVPFVAEDAGLADPLLRLLAPRVADLPRWLVLPAGAGLRRRMVLPAAAEARLREVLAFEIDRQTPFAAADVQHDVRLTSRRDDGQIEVELVVVPRAVLEAALDRLGPIASTLAGVDLMAEGGRTLGVNLLPGARRYQRADPWLAWNLALATVVLLATAAALWQTVTNRERATDAFEADVERLAADARLVSADKQQLIALVEGIEFLQALRAGRPTTVEVLDDLSNRLPDGTYLEKLSIEDDRILLIGLSREASSLVRLLEGSPHWRSPALTGALQPDPRTGRDRFTLTAELAIARPPATAATDTEDARARNRP
jgi:general secretion pathway protein L